MKKKIPPLVIEYVTDPVNLFYLSLIEYKRDNFLSIIDNITKTDVSAFVLDFANQEKINTLNFFSVVTNWFYCSSHLHPLSFELSKTGLSDKMRPLFRTFDINSISRIIGNPFVFDFESITKVKRRKVNIIPSTVEIRLKNKITNDHQ
jgi:hypothetical protein